MGSDGPILLQRDKSLMIGDYMGSDGPILLQRDKSLMMAR